LLCDNADWGLHVPRRYETGELTGRIEMGERGYMAGTKNRICRVWLSRLTRGNAENMLCAALTLGSSLACSGLAKSDDTFCLTEGNGTGPCIDIPGNDAWSCIGQEPAMLPQPGSNPVAFVQPVVDWNSLAPMAGRGLTAKLCGNLDSTCANPIAPPWVVQDRMLGTKPLPAGAAGVPVPEGWQGFIKFEVTPNPGDPNPDNLFVPEAYYLPGTISGEVSQGPPLVMLTRGLRANLLAQSFPSVDPATAATARGVVVSGIYDCKGEPAADVRVELLVNGQKPEGIYPFLLPPSRIAIPQDPTKDLYTSAQYRIAGFMNVPTGSVQVLAYRRGETEPYGQIEMQSVADQINVGPVRPRFLNSANLAGYTPLIPASQ